MVFILSWSEGWGGGRRRAEVPCQDQAQGAFWWQMAWWAQSGDPGSGVQAAKNHSCFGTISMEQMEFDNVFQNLTCTNDLTQELYC